MIRTEILTYFRNWKIATLQGGPRALHNSTEETPRCRGLGGSLFLVRRDRVHHRRQAAIKKAKVLNLQDERAWLRLPRTKALALWRHLGIGRCLIWLRYVPRRVECPRCGVHVEAVPWALHASRFTKDFEKMVTWLAQRSDKTTICHLMGINCRTVGQIISRIVPLLQDKKRLESLYVIGVDEISYRKNHKYVTLVVDHIKRHFVWANEGKSADSLKAFF